MSAAEVSPATGGEGSSKGHRRASSSATGVMSANDLPADKVLKLPKDAGKIGWKINTSSSTIPDPDVLKKILTDPPLKKIDIQFPTGVTVTARNLKGVTFKDALDAIHKQFKKRADDELSEPYLAGFYHDEDDKGKAVLRVGLSKEGAPTGKKGKKGGD
ncbi:hypothetical protein TWF696_004085 [Orbilia brochopaga]|uniref:DUF6699 domain-containing protein n=1 Tax=Orbilia brochopaga TaxID=3140254 RepID=A0AAV9V8A1_9PEZI